MEEITNYWSLLGHAGLGYTEIRVIDKDRKFKPECFFVDNKEHFIAAILNTRLHSGVDIFVGVNPRECKSGKASDVSYLTNLVLDLDNIKEEHKQLLSEIPFGVSIDSGRGLHYYYPVHPVNVKTFGLAKITSISKEWTDSIRKCLFSFCKVDHVYDLARVMRCPGTLNTKNGYPCKFISFPAEIIRNDFYNPPQIAINYSKDMGTAFSNLIARDSVLGSILDKKNKFKSPSERVYACVKQLILHGLSQGDIQKFIEDASIGREDKSYVRDIGRILEKASKETELKPLNLFWDSYKKGLDTREVGFDTGFPKLNDSTGGFRRKELIVLGARTNTGKTTLSMNFIRSMLNQNLKVLMFSTEMSFEPLVDKLVSMETRIPLVRFRDKLLEEQDKDKINSLEEKFSSYKLFISEIGTPTISDFEKEVVRLQPDVVVFDYIQMTAESSADTRARTIEHFVRLIKAICKKANACLIITSQLNDFDALRDSRAIEHPADIGLRLVNENSDSPIRGMVLKVTKNRYGDYAFVRLRFETDLGLMKEAN